MSIVTYNNRSIRNISAIPGAAKSLIHIKTLTADGSGTSLNFVNGTSDVVLDSTYPIYVFKYINIHPQTGSQSFSFQGSTNTGSSYGVTTTSTLFRGYHNEGDTATGVAYRGDYDVAQGTGFIPLSDGVALGNENDECVSGYIQLFEPSSTTFVKHFISRFNEYHQADYSIDGYVAGYFNTTSAIDAIQFKMSSGNLDAGTIKLYGIKDS